MLFFARLSTTVALLAAAAVIAFAVSARALTYTTMPMGNGWSMTTGPNGVISVVRLLSHP